MKAKMATASGGRALQMPEILYSGHPPLTSTTSSITVDEFYIYIVQFGGYTHPSIHAQEIFQYGIPVLVSKQYGIYFIEYSITFRESDVSEARC